MKIILSSLAARELVEESEKYESKAVGLGSLFIAEFETAIQQLQEFPESGPPFGRGFRRILVNRFPFSIIYAISDQTLRVVAIMHQGRGPGFIARRLDAEEEDNLG